MTNPMQVLSDAGINPFSVALLCESLLRHHHPETIEFFFPVNRSGWRGVHVKLVPIPEIVVVEEKDDE